MKCRSYTLPLNMDSPILHLHFNDANSTKWWLPHYFPYQRIEVGVYNGHESWLTTQSRWCSMLVQGAYRYSNYIHDLCLLKRKLVQIQNLPWEIMNRGLLTLLCSLWHWYISHSSNLFFSKSCSCKVSKFLLISSRWPLKLLSDVIFADRRQKQVQPVNCFFKTCYFCY